MGRSEIGLYDLTSVGGFSSFGIITTSTTFQNNGTLNSLSEAFKICVNFWYYVIW